VEERASALTPEQQRLAREAALQLRFALDRAHPPSLRVAHGLSRALQGDRVAALRELDALLTTRAFTSELAQRLESALERGRITVRSQAFDPIREVEEDEAPELPPLPPPRRESALTFFEVRFVDEIGQAIPRLQVEFALPGGRRTVSTNAAGVALLEDAESSSATVTVLDPDELETIIDPRWATKRRGKPAKQSNTVEVVFDGNELSPLPLKAVQPHTVVIKPPLGKLYVELWDKTGRVRHAGSSYKISGPSEFEGLTDDLGRLLQLDVFPGNYQIEFEVEVDAGKGPEIDRYESALVVLPSAASAPEVRMLGAVPRSVLVRLRMLFNTNKSFLLPTALPNIQKLRQLYFRNSPAKLLIVGHADTTGGDTYNEQLSLERARSTLAYLRDDVDTWLGLYDTGIDKKQRWGAPEDRMMLISMPDFREKPKGEDAVRWFQRTRGLKVDGVAGPQTRTQLITEYMGLDGSTLLGSAVEATAHGCGEYFPLLGDTAAGGAGELDPTPEDEKRDPTDRRVELFFFDREFGVIPEPPGELSKRGSSEYPAWRKRALETHVFEAGDLDGPKAIFVELADALFRSNSAVVLPEGETPEKDGEALESLQSVSAFAALLRFNAEHPGKKVLLAGHADTTNTPEFNLPLSEERAKCAHALLIGDREAWKTLSNDRHKVGDYKQILAWVSRAFDDLFFDCDPGAIDDVESTGVEPVRRFQRAYNENKAALGASAEADLEPDGDVGPLTWGAFFDCYEHALGLELGEDKEGVSALRAELVFVDPENPAIGFSEHFPIEELGVDQYRSQANRRVEMLTFDLGEEPDVAAALDDPETSELYLPGFYQRRPIELDNALRGATVDFVGVRGITRFSAGSDFPKPSLLGFVKAIQQKLSEEAVDVLLIGHTDDIDVDPSPDALSLSRADMVKAWLTGDSATLLPKFQNGGASKQWGFEEVQWMLQVMPFGDFPCYADRVDGYPGPNTLRALEYFQMSEDLPITGLADDATLERLVERYVELADAPVSPARVKTVGAGSAAAPLPFGEAKGPVFPDDAPQRRRRVEGLIFPPPLNPSEAGLAVDPSIYERWMRRAVQTLELSKDPPTLLALTDEEGLPIFDLGFEVLEADDAGNLQSVASGFTDNEGVASVVLPEGRYVVRADGAQAALEVSFDEFGGQMLVLLPPLES
jgi:outer membrane protein OmpA-like peptidoglycan-associated protein